MFGFRRLSDPKSMNVDHNRVIIKDDSSDSVVSDAPEDRTPARKIPDGWRGQMQKVMLSQEFQILVVVLVIMDCVFVIGELILDFQALSNAQTETSVSLRASQQAIRSVEAVPTQGEPSKQEKEVTAAKVLHYMSLSILSLFLIEITCKIIAFGTHFFKSKLEVFDAFIVIISFVLDVVSLIYEEQFAALQLLILLRLWRIVRVVNGVILSVETNAEKKIEAQKRLREELELELEKFRRYCSAQEKEIEVLRNELKNHGITINDEIALEKPEYPKNQLDVVVEVNKEIENEREVRFAETINRTEENQSDA